MAWTKVFVSSSWVSPPGRGGRDTVLSITRGRDEKKSGDVQVLLLLLLFLVGGWGGICKGTWYSTLPVAEYLLPKTLCRVSTKHESLEDVDSVP